MSMVSRANEHEIRPQITPETIYTRNQDSRSVFNGGNHATFDAFIRKNQTDEPVKPNDGHISLWEKAKALGKGLISPITSMFSSVTNFAIGVGMIAGATALCIATGGAAAPLLVAAGVGFGGYQLGKGIIKANTATTDKEAIQAWEDIGAGTSAIASLRSVQKLLWLLPKKQELQQQAAQKI